MDLDLHDHSRTIWCWIDNWPLWSHQMVMDEIELGLRVAHEINDPYQATMRLMSLEERMRV